MNKKILIVEDNVPLYETLKEYLDQMYEIIHAETGKQAIALLKDKPDMVLLDLKLPDMHAFEIIEKIKENVKYVIVLTGDVSSKTVVEAVQKGANDYIVKPVTPLLLKTTIAKYFSD